MWLTHPGAGSRAQAVSSGSVVRAGDTLPLGSNSQAIVSSSDGSTLRLYSRTVLVLGGTAAAPSVELRAGAVDVAVHAFPGRQGTIAKSPFLQARTLGTEFRLMVNDRSAWLGVRTGAVEVVRSADGQKVVLAVGNYAAVAPDWPFMKMNALVCPMWKSVCQQAAGSAYP